MISTLLQLVGLRPRVYYTLINFRGRAKAPPQYAIVFQTHSHTWKVIDLGQFPPWFSKHIQLYIYLFSYESECMPVMCFVNFLCMFSIALIWLTEVQYRPASLSTSQLAHRPWIYRVNNSDRNSSIHVLLYDIMFILLTMLEARIAYCHKSTYIYIYIINST